MPRSLRRPSLSGTRAREGYVRVRGLRTWYRVVGDLRDGGGRLPLLALHGGPGMPSDALEPLEALAADGRAVIRYDQLGCGRSDRPDDPSLWTISTFTEELDAVRAGLGLDRVHLLGWSWGGMLALEYALGRPRGLASLVLASAPASAPLWLAEVRRLRDGLPDHVTRAMRRFEERLEAPTRRRGRGRVRPGVSPARAQAVAVMARLLFDGLAAAPAIRLAAWASALPPLQRAAYEVVNVEFVRRHVMRGRPRHAPLCVFRSFAGMNRQVYETMWGPSEFCATGALAGWDVSDRLGEISVPTLVTSGRYDEATPAQMELLRDGIPGASWVVFEESAHAALLEEPERYRTVVRAFLEQVERGGTEQGRRSPGPRASVPSLAGRPDP